MIEKSSRSSNYIIK